VTERLGTGNASAPTSAHNYYTHGRPEMLRCLPETAERVLELGCAEGAFAATVKDRTGAEVWGIEFNAQVAERARAILDHVLVGDADERIAEIPDSYFDVVICNDVLEHLIDPIRTLMNLRRKLRSEGVIVASIPNIRYSRALSKVVLRKDFPKDDEGIFDRTHLHFFTRKSIVRTFEQAGFTLSRIEGINAHYGPLALLLTILSMGYFADTFYQQYACVASPRA
jgi:2-polyprenyl-3-methyl-5-hydroxy-6-metoxy-1,4-benzoquinol methylase